VCVCRCYNIALIIFLRLLFDLNEPLSYNNILIMLYEMMMMIFYREDVYDL